MRKLITPLFALAMFILAGCNKEEAEGKDLLKTTSLYGTWMVTESGYSPGAGYVVKPVPSDPQQLLTLNEDGSFSSTIEGWIGSYYTVASDTLTNDLAITFYIDDPGDSTSSWLQTYGIGLEGNMLKLYNRRCIEGCHIGFIRVE